MLAYTDTFQSQSSLDRPAGEVNNHYFPKTTILQPKEEKKQLTNMRPNKTQSSKTYEEFMLWLLNKLIQAINSEANRQPEKLSRIYHNGDKS